MESYFDTNKNYIIAKIINQNQITLMIFKGICELSNKINQIVKNEQIKIYCMNKYFIPEDDDILNYILFKLSNKQRIYFNINPFFKI